MTDRIEAIERTIRQGVQVLRLGVTENARMDPADAAEHEVLTALDRLIQALKEAERLRDNNALAWAASNEERERVRPLPNKWRAEAYSAVMISDGVSTALMSCADDLLAALSHPISPERSDEGTEK